MTSKLFLHFNNLDRRVTAEPGGFDKPPFSVLRSSAID